MRHRDRNRCRQALSILLMSYAAAVEATPIAALPINAQIPPVARVGQPFSFEFSPSTFSTKTPPLSYSIANAPRWLSLDNATRTILGTPSQADLGNTGFTLLATDASGTASVPVSLIITSDQGPSLDSTLATEFKTTGTIADQNTILYRPANSISVTFPSGTFTNTDSSTIYYATSTNNTPLPSWLIFNDHNLSFTGLAPSSTSDLQLPQSFPVRMAASNLAGFYTAQITFSIVLETHQLYFKKPNYTVFATSGQKVAYDGLQDSLVLDGNSVPVSELRHVTAIVPPWLSFDNETLILSGTAPINMRTGAIAIFAEDIYGDTANATVDITTSSEHDLIIKDPGPLHATIGENFQYKFAASSFAPNVNTTISLGEAASWLSYNNATLTLSGKVPSNLSPEALNLVLTVTQSSNSQTQDIQLQVTRNQLNGSSTATIPPHSIPTSLLPTSTPEDDQLRIAEAVIIPIIILLAVLLLIFCVRRNRRKKSENWKHDHPVVRDAKKRELSFWFRRRIPARKRRDIPISNPRSISPSGTTSRFGNNYASQTNGIPSNTHKKPQYPMRPAPSSSGVVVPLSPASTTRHPANSRWSFRNRAGSDIIEQYSESLDSFHSFSVSSRSPASSQRTTRRVTRFHRLDPIGGHAIHPDADPSLPKDTTKVIQQSRQSISPGRGRADLPGRRSLRGRGHGHPFPGEDVHAQRASMKSRASAGTWTDILDTSRIGLPNMSSAPPYSKHPQEALSGTPQIMNAERRTIRTIVPSSGDGERRPSQADSQAESATTKTRSEGRPPSFQSFISARNGVIRRFREKESTSFSGYRAHTTSNSSREWSAERDESVSRKISTPLAVEEAVPTVPLRLRPALNLEEAQRDSTFYSSRTKSSGDAQRKGSLIHNRFISRGGVDGADFEMISETDSQVIHDNQRSGESPGANRSPSANASQTERPPSPDTPLLPRKSSERELFYRSNRSAAASSEVVPSTGSNPRIRVDESNSPRDTVHSSGWTTDDAVLDASHEYGIAVPIPPPLRVRHSWFSSSESQSVPSDENEADMLGEANDIEWEDIYQLPSPDGKIITGTVARRPVSVDPTDDGRGRSGLTAAQSMRANIHREEEAYTQWEERRDLSVRFL